MKKKKNKPSKTTIISMVVGGGLGFLIAIFGGTINRIIGFSRPPFYIIIPIIVLTFVLSVMLHEFGHALIFLVHGIKIRGIIFVNFLFIREKRKWKFKIIKNKSLGGIVIPEIQNIKNQEEFLKVQKGFANALIAGPIVSIVSWALLTAIGVRIITTTENLQIRSNTWVFLIALFIITFFIVITSFFKSDIVIGDFPAYKIAKTDKFFVAIQLYNYGYLSSKPEKAREENVFLKEYIIKELEGKYENGDTHWYTLSMVDTILVEYLAGFLKELPGVVEDYIDLILKRPNILSGLRRNQEKEIMYFHIIMYLYQDENTRDGAYELYENIKNTIKANTPKRKYLFKQVEHMLGVSNNEEFLRDKKNIENTDMHFIYKHFPGFFIDEIAINKILTKEII